MDTLKDKVMTYLDVYNSDCINPTNNINPSNILNLANNINDSNNISPSNIPNHANNINDSNNIRSSNIPNHANNINDSNNINPSNILNLANNINDSNNINPSNIPNHANNINDSNDINPSNILNHANNINDSNNINACNNDSAVPTNSGEISIEASNSSESKQTAKKGRKVKSNKSQWRKEKGNKYLNKPYRNYKGIEIKSKDFVDYDCKCQMKCKEILSAAERKQEFQKFWELGSYEAQAIFLIARVDEQVTKKSTKKKKEKKDDKEDSSEQVDTPDGKKSKRQFSRTYILKSKQVCRNMFVRTLGITSKRINTALVKMRSKSLIDHRGLSQGGKNKISEKRYDEVVDHIKRMPRYKCSHLQGKFDSEFLPPELSLSKMYDLYSKEVDQPVSLSMYKKIYYGKFNFKTKGIKKEICNICKGERKIKNENLKKQQQLTREKHQYPCPSPPNDQVILQHHQYRPTNNFMPPPPINCNQSWLPPPNFQMPHHNPAHYFEQPMGYE